MPELHAHGVELVVNLLDAADHLDNMAQEDIRWQLREAAVVLGDLLKRDKPERLPSDGALPDIGASAASTGARRP
jgi:hypothetical protein